MVRAHTAGQNLCVFHWFVILCKINQVRRHVFDNYQQCPVSLKPKCHKHDLNQHSSNQKPKSLSPVLSTAWPYLATKSSNRPRDLYHSVVTLDFTPFQLIVTNLRLDEIIVWCHVTRYECQLSLLHYCYGNREHDQKGDSAIKVHTMSRYQTRYEAS